MDSITLIIISVFALVVGALVGFLLGRVRNAGLVSDINQRREEAERSLAACRAEFDTFRTTSRESFTQQLDSTRESYEKQLDAARENVEERLETVSMDYERRLANQRENFARQSEAQKESYEKQLAEQRKSFTEQLAAADSAREKLFTENEKRHQQMMDETRSHTALAIEKAASQLQNAAEKMLHDRQEEFRTASQQSIGNIITPLRQKIEEMSSVMNQNTEKQIDFTSAIRQSLGSLENVSKETRRSAEELSRVFKTRSKVQGDWGEQILTELLTSQGLTEGIHFDTQSQLKDELGNAVISDSGRSMRPDVILHLDRSRDVIIDSKVSMTAFMEYVNADTEEERAKALQDHIASLKKHVDELSRKDYSSYIKTPRQKLDYVIMFVPNTNALWTALQASPDLWRSAMQKNVYIADEQTLYAALRIVSMTWNQIAQARNHEEVYRLATEMLDRVGQFVKNYDAVGKALKKAQEAYDDGARKFSEKGQSIKKTCAKLVKLGAKQSDRNPVPELDDFDEDLPVTLPSPEGQQKDLPS